MVDHLTDQPQRIQKVGVIIGVLPDGDGSLKHRLHLVIGKGAVILLEPCDRALPQGKDAVDGDDGSLQTVFEYRLLNIHIKAVAQCQQDKLGVIGLCHVGIVGNAVADIKTVVAFEEVNICGKQPVILPEKPEPRPAVGVKRVGKVDLFAVGADIAAGGRLIDLVITMQLRQGNGGAAFPGERTDNPRIGRDRITFRINDAKGTGGPQHNGRYADHQYYDGNE